MYFQCYKKELGSIPLAKYSFPKGSKRTFAEEMKTIDINHFATGLNLLTRYLLGGVKKQTLKTAEILRKSDDKNITR